ncbi:hypothetical protein E2C01_007910 [Portunus trituberculatus]|uniref:Uncharacterized protein n=1 Tax=Portunus trituberculatus TaxID=210409 RepID=A0A5B7CZD3_PORTR|nr:hypothetical protein [Portunus trituberculatus]
MAGQSRRTVRCGPSVSLGPTAPCGLLLQCRRVDKHVAAKTKVDIKPVNHATLVSLTRRGLGLRGAWVLVPRDALGHTWCHAGRPPPAQLLFATHLLLPSSLAVPHLSQTASSPPRPQDPPPPSSLLAVWSRSSPGLPPAGPRAGPGAARLPGHPGITSRRGSAV